MSELLTTPRSGKVGVGWDKRHKQWEARIMVNRRQIYLGGYQDVKLAIEARVAAEKKFRVVVVSEAPKKIKFPGAICGNCGRKADDGLSFATKNRCARDYRNERTPKPTGGHPASEWLGGVKRRVVTLGRIQP